MHRRLLFFAFLLVICLTSFANVTVDVGKTATIYCNATAPAGYIDHVFFYYTNPDDANYVAMGYDSRDGKATIYGLQAKSNIKIEVVYTYTYTGSYDNRRHVGSGSYYTYIDVKHSLVVGTAYKATTEEGHGMYFLLSQMNNEWFVATVPTNQSFCCLERSDVKGKVTIPSKVQGFPVKMIAGNSFFCCDEITDIIIPSTVKEIGQDAFYQCFGLENVVCLCTTPPTDYTPDYGKRKTAFYGSSSSAVLYVPKGSKSKYQSAAGWKEFKTIKEIGVDGGIAVNSVKLDSDKLNLNTGENKQLTATVSPSNATDRSCSWTSSNTSVASVTQTGYVVAKAPGTATITCTANDGNGAKNQCIITVKDVEVESLTLDTESAELFLKDTKQLTSEISPANATNKTVTWTSNNTTVATVSTTGLVTAKAIGTAIITCKANDGSGKSASCIITVKKNEATAISIPSSKTIKVDESTTLTYTLTPTNADATVSWKSSDTGIATVSSTGVVRGIAVGVAKITATTDNGKTSTCTVTVEAKQIVPTKISIYSTSVEVGYTTKMRYTLEPEGATTTIKWSSSDTSIATVASDGTITGKKVGRTTITATTANGLSDWYYVSVEEFKEGTTFDCVTTEGNVIKYRVKDISKRTCEIASNFNDQSIKGKVTIPSSVQGYTPVSMVSSAFSQCNNLESISLPNTIEEIGRSAFWYCESLKSISLPNKLTRIEIETFGHCKSLKSISLPTSLESIGPYAFWYCDSLESVSLSSKVKTIDTYAFCYCKSLKSFTGYNNLEYIGKSAFNQNPWIENLSEGINYIGKVLYNYKGTMPENTTLNIKEGCTQICSGALSNKSGLVSLYIPESVTSITDNPFYGCSNLKTIKVAATNKVFDSRNNCNAIMETKTNLLKTACVSTVIPNNTKAIGFDAFYFIGSIKEISIPNSVDSLANYALYSHEKINIGKGLRVFGNYSFYNLKNTKSISVDAGNQYFDSRQNCNAIIEKATNTLRVGCSNTVIPETVKAIGDYAFYYKLNDSIVNITIPNNIEKVGNDAYSGNSAIQLITIGKKVKELGAEIIYSSNKLKAIHSLIDFPTDINENAFRISPTYGADSLYNHAILYVPKGSRGNYISATGWKKFKNIVEVDDDAMVEGTLFKHKTVEGIELTYMVTNYKNRECEWIRIPDGISGTVTVPSVANGYTVKGVGDNVVSNYSGKVNIVLPDAIERIGDSSFYYSGVTSVNIPSSLKSVGQWSFWNTEIEEINIPKSCESIAKAAFAHNSNLKKITVDAGNKVYDSRNNSNIIYEKSTNTLVMGCANSVVPEETETIGYEAFYYAENLKSIKLNSSLKKIEDFAFFRTGIANIEIPASVKTIEKSAFRQCKELKDITVYAKTPIAISDSVFFLASDTIYTFKNATLHVPAGTKSAYQAAKGWKEFKNIVEMTTPVESINLNATSASIVLNEAIQIKATISPDDATDKTVKWSTSDSKVATVSSSGLVTAVGRGRAIIFCEANDRGGAKATYDVTVLDVRNVSTSRAGYATFYDSQISYELPAGLKAEVVSSVTNNKLSYTSVGNSVIPKGTAVMLTASSKKAETYKLVESQSSSTYSGTNYLHGSDDVTTTSAAGDNYYFKLSYGNDSMNNIFGWYWGSNNGAAFRIDGHKAWLAIPKSSVTTRSFSIEGEATGIVELMNDDDKTVVYDLQGRRIKTLYRSGLYIQNGKKVIIQNIR